MMPKGNNQPYNSRTQSICWKVTDPLHTLPCYLFTYFFPPKLKRNTIIDEKQFLHMP